jgi:hypothetical protein
MKDFLLAQTAWTQVQNWMVGATMANPCSQNGTVWTCTLTRSNYKALAVWNTAGCFSFSVPSDYTQYRDLAGGTTQLNGAMSVTIGIQPIQTILLENLNAATGDITPPSVPTNLSASAVSSSQINLSRTASTDNVGVTGYKIYRAGTQIATVTSGTSSADTGLSPKKWRHSLL